MALFRRGIDEHQPLDLEASIAPNASGLADRNQESIDESRGSSGILESFGTALVYSGIQQKDIWEWVK
jgi:hypothetical protein